MTMPASPGRHALRLHRKASWALHNLWPPGAWSLDLPHTCASHTHSLFLEGAPHPGSLFFPVHLPAGFALSFGSQLNDGIIVYSLLYPVLLGWDFGPLLLDFPIGVLVPGGQRPRLNVCHVFSTLELCWHTEISS